MRPMAVRLGRSAAGAPGRPLVSSPRQSAAHQLASPKKALSRRPRMRPLPPQAAGAAVALVAGVYAFTPAESLLGGLTLGVLASSKFLLLGRILGISGIVGGIVRGSAQAWRAAFLLGLLAGGAALQLLLPTAFEALPAAYSLQRAILAGLLVGVGTSMGSGCTSGHGICGNSRLSVRSVVATITFMLSGAVATHLAGTAAVFGLPQGVAPLTLTAAAAVGTKFGAGLLAATVAAMAAVSWAAKRLEARAPTAGALQKELQGAEELEESPLTGAPPPEPTDAQKLASLAVFTELLVGFLFALGLGVSGMVRPSKVTAFLAVISGTFDPSLMLVMGGALLVSVPIFQAVLRFKTYQRPVCAPCFDLPSKSHIDAPLVLGALLFGAGWGIGGVCPGPGLVNLASLQPQAIALVVAMLVGMRLEKPLSAALFGKSV